MAGVISYGKALKTGIFILCIASLCYAVYVFFLYSFNADLLTEFKNVTIRNTVCRGAGRALRVDGLTQLPIHDITLENVELTAKTGFFCKEAENIHFKNVTITNEKQPEQKLHYDEAVFAGGDASEF